MTNPSVHVQQVVLPLCPKCGSYFSDVSARKVGETAGPWYCDTCGHGITLVFAGADTVVTPYAGNRKVDLLVLLENSDSGIFLVVKGMTFEQGPLDNLDQSYFYNSHTCPTNYLGVVAILDGVVASTDPHGIFEFCEAVPCPPDFDEQDVHNEEGYAGWQRIFPKTNLSKYRVPDSALAVQTQITGYQLQVMAIDEELEGNTVCNSADKGDLLSQRVLLTQLLSVCERRLQRLTKA